LRLIYATFPQEKCAVDTRGRLGENIAWMKEAFFLPAALGSGVEY
jgi:hypothetical protein